MFSGCHNNIQDFEVQFWLWKSQAHDIIKVDYIYNFNIVFNYVEVRDQISVVFLNEVHYNFWFDILQSSVDVSYILAQHGYNFFHVSKTHRNNYLLFWETLSCYINFGSFFLGIIHDLVNFFNLLGWKMSEVFLNFNNIIDIAFRCLCISMSILRREKKEEEEVT